MKQHDILGRATFHNIAPKRVTKLTPRAIRWLKHIERHGAQSSDYLHGLTNDTHRCADTARRQMQKLRAGGYLRLPQQQRATEHADFNPFIYDLTAKAEKALVDLGIAEDTTRPTGHWWHAYMTSCVTSSIDIASNRVGVRYIPAHKILAIKQSSLAVQIGQQKLIADQLFALDYGGSFRAFMLEVDRGTEPKISVTARKSYAKAIEQYRKLVEQEIYKKHFGLKANLLILWVFNSRSNEMRFLDMVDKFGGKLASVTLTQSWPEWQNRIIPRGINQELYQGIWSRAAGDPVRISG